MHPKSYGLAARSALSAIAAALAGCASYPSMPPGPDTAEVTVAFSGDARIAKLAGVYEDPAQCRHWQRIDIDQTRTATIVVPARVMTMELVSAGGRLEYQTAISQTCRFIMTFDPKPGHRYTFSHVDVPEGCRMRVTSAFAGRVADITTSVTFRKPVDPKSIPITETAPSMCADTYTPPPAVKDPT